MSLNGLTSYNPLTINGLDTVNIGGSPFDPNTLVPYVGANNNVLLQGPIKIYQDYNASTALSDVSVLVNRQTMDSATSSSITNLLSSNNTWTGTNTINNNLTTSAGYTTDLNGVIQTKLNSLGFTSASFTTSGITGTYTPPLGTITNVSGSTYQIAQTAQGRSIMAISGFAPSVLTTYVFQINIKCTIGTAILSVEQDNILRSPQYYQLSTSFNTITGTFYYDGTPNTIIFKIYTGVASWNAQWDSFTLSTYSANIINAPLYAPRITTATSIAMTTAGGSLTMLSNGSTTHASGDNSYTKYGPNSSWGKYLIVGATPDLANATTAQLIGTNGDIFIDAANNQGIYYGNYASGRGTPNSHTFYGTVNLAGNEVIQGGYSFKKIGGNVGQNYTLLTGDDTLQSPYLTFYQGNLRRMYIGNASTTEAQIATENGAQLAFITAGSTRMTIKTDGTATQTNGDNSVMKYGPNSTWTAYLSVGSGTDKSGASTAQVLSTNGNLHLDAGNSNDIYYGYYPSSRGTPNTHQFYGTSVNFPSGLPQNGTSFSQVAVFDGNTLKRSQATQRLVYFSNNVAWGGGVNMVNAFYLYNTACSVQFWGKNSGYYSGAGMMQTTIRVYSQSAGTYYYYPLNAFVNVGYNHFTVPLNYAASFPYTGWYDIYVYSTSGWITDGNDQLTIGVTILPASGY